MKKQNKCFFSIGLTNGITISGNSPQMVLNFLYKMHSAFYSDQKNLINDGYTKLSDEQRINMYIVGMAIDTINQNYHK